MDIKIIIIGVLILIGALFLSIMIERLQNRATRENLKEEKENHPEKPKKEKR